MGKVECVPMENVFLIFKAMQNTDFHKDLFEGSLSILGDSTIKIQKDRRISMVSAKWSLTQ